MALRSFEDGGTPVTFNLWYGSLHIAGKEKNVNKTADFTTQCVTYAFETEP